MKIKLAFAAFFTTLFLLGFLGFSQINTAKNKLLVVQQSGNDAPIAQLPPEQVPQAVLP